MLLVVCQLSRDAIGAYQVNIQSNRWYIPRIFQIWSTPAGYEELGGGFKPIRTKLLYCLSRIMLFIVLVSARHHFSLKNLLLRQLTEREFLI